MADHGTMRDYIEDLILQRDALNAQVGDLEAEVARLSESEQRYASDYFRLRRVIERLTESRSAEAKFEALQEERDELSDELNALRSELIRQAVHGE